MEGMYGSASGMQQPLVVPPLSNRVSSPAVAQQPVYQQDGATMRKLETGGGHYQQAELGISSAQQTTAASAAELNRGIRHAGAFIPPRPVDPESARGFGASMPAPQRAPQTFEDDSAFAPDLSARPAGLQLNPPVPGMRSSMKKPSLFDKIAGMFSENEDESGDDQGSASGGHGSAGGLFSGFTARRSAPQMPQQTPSMPEPQFQQQPAAPVAQPQTQQQGQDLEIPAFLRRQVS